MTRWLGPHEGLSEAVRAQSAACLRTYAEDPLRVEADANIEVTTAEGGYGRKQIYELIQNGADALLTEPGRIHVILTADCLYVANEGKPVNAKGVEALLSSHLSRKRSDEIGRFGLGFKSVAAISDSPQVFSRSGSFGFDRAKATARIREVVPNAPRYPILRLAEPLDPQECAVDDPILGSLMVWATTVIRVPLKDGHELLAEDLDGFPGEFVLFSPHVHELQIEDRSKAGSRVIRLADDGSGLLQLDDKGIRSSWRVVKAVHRPSAEAAKDAGELANREQITLHWAVPMQNRARMGQFWAFFPTQALTTLSGIINATWKLSDDRRNLLEGQFNRELLTDALPSLIARSLPGLAQPDDPSAVLDLLPARGKESRSWADDVINAPIFVELSRTVCLPDLGGVFRTSDQLRIHPRDLAPEWLSDWLSVGSSLRGWVNHGVDRTLERRLKADRLIGTKPWCLPDITAWIEALCEPVAVANSAAAVSLVARIVREADKPEVAAAAARAKVLLLEDGRLVAPTRGTVFVRASSEETGYEFIDPQLAALPGAVSALESLGIHVLDRSGELRNALTKVDQRRIEWDRVWSLTRGLPGEISEAILREALPEPLEDSVRVRTVEGKWCPLGQAFLGGGVIPLDGSRDRAFLIDPGFHQPDQELLDSLGAVPQPVNRHSAPPEPWLEAYKDIIAEDFIVGASGAKPARDRLVLKGPTPPWPLDALSRLSPKGQVALTNIALTLESTESWNVSHISNKSYGRKNYKSPVAWWLNKHGKLDTAFGPWDVRDCLMPSEDNPDDILPVPDVTDSAAKRLGLRSDASELSDANWYRMMEAAASWTDELLRYTVYAWAVHYVDAPQTLAITEGGRTRALEPKDVAVVGDPEIYRSLIEQHIPAVYVEQQEDVDHLIKRWHMAEGSRLLQRELLVDPVGEAELLVDRFPALRLRLELSLMGIELQRCSSIELVTATPRGQVSKPVPGQLYEGKVHVTAGEPREMLQQISNALQLDLSSDDIRSILDQQRQQEAQELLADIRAAEDTDHRLALAVGGPALRRALPATALEAIEGELGRPLDERELASLAQAVHGVGVLQHFRSVLDERGLNPPVQWAGLSSARRFVTELGFSTEYAGFASDKRAAVFDVDGPAELGPLHDFQVVVTDRIKSLIGGEGPARGMVSLPTGAGKTRVAVQALVDEVREGRLLGPIIWIAQSDELCEQAVQTWAYVWRAVGPGTRMTISRFWSGNDVTEDPENFQLVVATTDKLRNAVDTEAHEWMTQATLVVVDEAHSSVAPMYTSVLEWLGRGRSRAERRPLIGLTATPFRNTNVEETDRLASRYDRNRLDQGAFEGDPYAQLQKRGVLARVQHRVLEGVEVKLTADDRAEIDKFNRLPRYVESRLGENYDRNRRIVQSVVDLPKDWTVLMFSTSVENARAIAAQLTFKGVPSVAISAETDPAARRHYIKEFQRGAIRVITNYNVLAQGFDAPAVRAVYVTRPTFSKNLYQQMIGRGLRGPLNGGSEEVLIVNVQDNLQQYGDRLAFFDFEHLWSKE